MASIATHTSAPQNNFLKGVANESGQITPSHGGMVTGMEYDLPIDARAPNRESSPLRPADDSSSRIPRTPLKTAKNLGSETTTQTATPPETPEPSSAPIARLQATNGSRQRPVSMPPQSYAPSVTGSDSRSSRNETTQQHRTKPAGRVLGSYTMTKTLGAGSMGKVKLAVHNQTGEKVCSSRMFPSLSH